MDELKTPERLTRRCDSFGLGLNAVRDRRCKMKRLDYRKDWSQPVLKLNSGAVRPLCECYLHQ